MRHIVERTDKAEIKLEEQSEKTESCRENSWNEIRWRSKGRSNNLDFQNSPTLMDSVGNLNSKNAPLTSMA